jgi:hypothetical protein
MFINEYIIKQAQKSVQIATTAIKIVVPFSREAIFRKYNLITSSKYISTIIHMKASPPKKKELLRNKLDLAIIITP